MRPEEKKSGEDIGEEFRDLAGVQYPCRNLTTLRMRTKGRKEERRRFVSYARTTFPHQEFLTQVHKVTHKTIWQGIGKALVKGWTSKCYSSMCVISLNIKTTQDHSSPRVQQQLPSAMERKNVIRPSDVVVWVMAHVLKGRWISERARRIGQKLEGARTALSLDG